MLFLIKNKLYLTIFYLNVILMHSSVTYMIYNAFFYFFWYGIIFYIFFYRLQFIIPFISTWIFIAFFQCRFFIFSSLFDFFDFELNVSKLKSISDSFIFLFSYFFISGFWFYCCCCWIYSCCFCNFNVSLLFFLNSNFHYKIFYILFCILLILVWFH